MFLNISNHPSSKWSAEQIEAARRIGGEIVDVPFPNVPDNASMIDIYFLRDRLIEEIESRNAVVMIQGESNLTYAVVSALEFLHNWMTGTVFAATTRRETVETVEADGSTKKTSVFRFSGFRPYF